MTRKNPERRQELMTAAQRLFYTKGYENTSINDIAQAAGVTKGAFYHYFDSKEDVIEAIAQQGMDHLLTMFNAILQDSDLTVLEKLKRYVDAGNSWKVEQLDSMLLLLRNFYRPENTIMRLRIQARRREAGRDAFTQVLAEGNAAGVFHVDDLPAMTTILIAVLQNYEDEFASLLLDEDRGSAERLAMAKRHTAALNLTFRRLLGMIDASFEFVSSDAVAPWFLPKENQ